MVPCRAGSLNAQPRLGFGIVVRDSLTFTYIRPYAVSHYFPLNQVFFLIVDFTHYNLMITVNLIDKTKGQKTAHG